MKKIIYFSFVGSYEGLVKCHGQWYRINNLNYIDKINWDRWQGPMSRSMEKAIKSDFVIDGKKFEEFLQNS